MNNFIAHEMANYSGKVTLLQGNIMGHIRPDIEFLKWLSYEPNFEKERIAFLNSQESLSFDELEELNRYKKNKIMATLFRKYILGKCSKKEYMLVYEFMGSEKIENLILSKLTKEELEYVKKEVTRLKNYPEEVQRTTLDNGFQRKNYEKLSMPDAYVLHILDSVNNKKSMSKLTKEIASQIEANKAMREISFNCADYSLLRKL